MPGKLAVTEMIVRYCSICSTSFDLEVEGDDGQIGLIPFALCGDCKAGIFEYVLAAEVFEDMNQ